MTSDKLSEYLDNLDFDDRMGACVEYWVNLNSAKNAHEDEAMEYTLFVLLGKILPMPEVPCL